MKITEIIKKFLAGTELTPDEKKYLAEYKEAAIDKTKENELTARVAELEKEKEEAEKKSLPEQEQVKKDLEKIKAKLAAAEQERDAAKAAKTELERDNSIRAIAAENKFKNFEYLKFNLGGAKVDLTNQDAIKAHMDQLRKDSPEFFTADINSGGAGSGAGNGSGGSAVDPLKAYSDAKAAGNFVDMVANAPIIKE